VAVVSAANLNASSTAPVAASDNAVSTRPVYFDGRPVELAFARARRAKTAFRFGPWELDAHVSHDKPRDPHPNLYIVAPGDQYTSEQVPAFNHTEIISTIPVKVEPREWDLYWAIVLDPALQETFHSERQLILATQDGFNIPSDFDLDSMPGITFLRDFLHVQTVDDLARFRRADGTLPRVIIVPAGVSIKATAVDPEAPPEEGKSSLSRAISAIIHGRDRKSSAGESASDPPKD
jgi:hypothetical protein